MARKTIPLRTKLAAALAMLLPQAERDQLRAERRPSTMVISRFDFHHGKFWSLERDNHWSNLTPLLRATHRERTRGDLKTIAKVKRLERTQAEFRKRMLVTKRPPPKPKSKWPKRPLRRGK